MQVINTEVLVIGAGGAGLRAAIEAAKQGLEVQLLCKEVLGCAHTGMAMGGMNAALVKPATPRLHYEDTMDCGWSINRPGLVKVFVEEIRDRVLDLEKYGLLFDRMDDGGFYTWRGGKQTAPLNVCVGDYTGREMMQALVDEVRRLSVSYADEFFVQKLLSHKKEIAGAMGIDLKTGETVLARAKAVILATGGAGRMYQVTTNAASNTGDGYAMALSVGARLVDMEMIQFHPTGMVVPDSSRGLLVTEKVRGHGGRLFNKKQERFLKNYYPEKMELAGRDEIARAIFTEVKEDRGTDNDGVYLDVTHWPEGEVEDKIPDVFEQYMTTGVDIRKQPMEIYPTMHHMCGGVEINVDAETNVPGLLAVGEVVGGVHGANRMGGNSIAEGQVFGRRSIVAARRIVEDRKSYLPISKLEIKREVERLDGLMSRRKGVSTYLLEEKLKELMWNKVGIVRSDDILKEAQKELSVLDKKSKMVKIGVKNLARNKELQDVLELSNMIATAKAVVESALVRRESRGAHWRSDYPDMDEAWFGNLVVAKRGGKLKTRFEKIKE